MMTSLLIRWFVNALALIVVAYIVPGISVSSFYIALVVAIALAIVNVTLKPLLILFTLPITILTLGLFTFVIDALMLLFVSSFVDGFAVSGLLPAFVGALLLALVHALLHRFMANRSLAD